MLGMACDPLQHTSMYQRAEEGIRYIPTCNMMVIFPYTQDRYRLFLKYRLFLTT